MQFSFLSQLPFIHSTCKTFHEDLPAQLSPIQYFLFLPFPVGCFNHRRFTKSPFFHWRTAWPSGNGITFASHIPGFFISLSTKPKSCSTEHAVRLGKLRVVGNNQRVFRLDRLLRSTWCPIFNRNTPYLKNHFIMPYHQANTPQHQAQGLWWAPPRGKLWQFVATLCFGDTSA